MTPDHSERSQARDHAEVVPAAQENNLTLALTLVIVIRPRQGLHLFLVLHVLLVGRLVIDASSGIAPRIWITD